MKIEVNNLSKQYGRKGKKALKEVNLKIESGIFGLLGENGAGKTTLLKILATILNFDEGSVQIGDFDLKKDKENVRDIMGYMPQSFDFFQNLTVFEMMDYIASLKNMEKGAVRKGEIERFLSQVNLTEQTGYKIKQLSGGMKQRLGIAQCMLGNPKFIILDEPTAGLDPSERIRFRNLLNEISQDRVILLSTHIIGDIAMMCDDVAILKEGNVQYCGSTDELIESVKGRVGIIHEDIRKYRDEGFFKNIISINRHHGETDTRFIIGSEGMWQGYELAEPTLEDAYFYKMYL